MSEILITSSALILAVILLRLFFRNKVSRRLIYGAWLLVALRLLIPVQIGNLNFSILAQVQPVTDAIVNMAQKPVAGPSREEAYDNTLQDYLSQGQTVFIPEVQQQVETQLQSGKPQHEVYEELLNTGKPEEILLPEVNQQIETEVSKALAPTFGQIAAMIWIVGMIAMAAWFTAVNLSFRRKLRSGATNLEVSDCKTSVKVSPHIASPCLFGLLRPTVYLTPKCVGNDQTRHHVLTHELTHLRSGDHIWSWVRCICLCIYWFNPLVWVAASLSRRDCELACDETALKTLGDDQRIAYGKTLLDMVSSVPAPGQLLETATAMHETNKQLKERMRCIVKKPKVFLTAAIVLLLVLTIVTGCTFSGIGADHQNPGDTVPTTPNNATTVPITTPITTTTAPIPTTQVSPTANVETHVIWDTVGHNIDEIFDRNEMVNGTISLLDPLTSAMSISSDENDIFAVFIEYNSGLKTQQIYDTVVKHLDIKEEFKELYLETRILFLTAAQITALECPPDFWMVLDLANARIDNSDSIYVEVYFRTDAIAYSEIQAVRNKILADYKISYAADYSLLKKFRARLSKSVITEMMKDPRIERIVFLEYLTVVPDP